MVDGDQPYTILTAPAVSADPAYDGLDPADVSVTNTDDDVVAVPVIAAAGGTLLAEDCGPGNGAIDPDETVTVSLALVNGGTAPTIDLVATLLPIGGVTEPGGPQSYGVLTPGAAAESRPFTFTASGSCGGTVSATLHLQDGPEDLGMVTFGFPLGAVGAGGTTLFASAAAVDIPSSGAAAPYPSSISVSGLTGTVAKVKATLTGFGHAFPDDVDVLLVGPGGQRMLLLSDAGGGGAVSGLALTFDDAAASALPDGGPLSSGTWKPSAYEPASDAFPSPAPGEPYGTTLSVFEGTNPNGTWSLYVRDDFSGGAGTIAGGWSLSITTSAPVCCTAPPAGMTVSPTTGLVTTEAGGTATFTVVLNSAPAADVTIGLASSNLAEGTVAPASLTFTPANALLPQTVTVTGVDDSLADGPVAYTVTTAPAVSDDPHYAGLDPSDVSVTNTDDDTAGITVSPTSGLVTTEAGGSANFTVVLKSIPAADVTIGLASSDLTEGTVTPTSLTFTPADALSPKMVTVTGVDDPIVDGSVAYSIVTAPAVSADPTYAGLDPADVSVTNTDDEPADLIFKDGFESGGLLRWSASQNVGGRLAVSRAAALDGSFGLSAQVTDTSALYVQDDTPSAEPRYRARFLFDPNGFNPGGGGGNSTVRLLVAFQGTSTRTVTVVLRRRQGQFSVQAQALLDGGGQSSTAFVNVTDAPHAIELDWRRASTAGANDGSLQLWIDGAAVPALGGLNNDTTRVDMVRLGPQNLQAGASGTLLFDRFESRRQTPIGP